MKTIHTAYVPSLHSVDFGAIHNGNIHFFNESNKATNRLLLKDRSYGLSMPLTLDDLLEADALLQHRTIQFHQRQILEKEVLDQYVQSGSSADYVIGNVMAFLYEEFFPSMVGVDFHRHLQGTPFEQIEAESRASFKATLEAELADLQKMDPFEKFLTQTRRALESLADRYSKQKFETLTQASKAALPDSCLIWDSKFIPMRLGQGNDQLVIGSETTNFALQRKNNKDYNDDLNQARQDNVTSFLCRSITDEQVRDFYSKVKYGSMVFHGSKYYEGIGFEVVKEDDKVSVFLYIRLPPFFMKDPRPTFDAYYPYESKDVGLLLGYSGGQIQILNNCVRGPTGHRSIAASNARYASMCGLDDQYGSQSDFPRRSFWIHSCLSLVAESFMNAYMPEDMRRHGANLTEFRFEASDRMPEPVTAVVACKPGNLITNQYEWNERD